jgi:hypothetical protein
MTAALALSGQPAPDLLRRKCQGCHNNKNRASGLSMETRRDLETGGNRGPAAIPGKPSESRLLSAVRHAGDLKMPPGGRLTDAEAAAIESWIAAGMPGIPSEPAASKPSHWAFNTPVRPALPAVSNEGWVRTALDRFILARLDREKLRPSPEADSVTLLRRLSLDLTGLPPSPAEVDAFLADREEGAYERQVERLLSSPHYGERWARHWLDQARYADSDGGSRDEPRQIWKYREWVIRALNGDMPFDRFVTEQLAGDLLPHASHDQIVATGFQRNSLLQIEAGTDREQYRVEAVSDRVDTFGTVFLGLATGCARCHDHKFDPITQREYYRLFAFFNNVEEYGPELPPFSETGDLEVTHRPLQALGKPEDVAKYDAIREQLLALYRERFEFKERFNPKPNDPRLTTRSETIAALKKQIPKVDLAMVMRERPRPRESHVLLGGDFLRKGIPVTPAVPAAFHRYEAPAKPGGAFDRLDLARWVVDKRNPLLARVAVNRIWSHYFGRGIVETENDFGTQGARPSHPELLDWLAIRFMDSDWSQKVVHRAIVESSVYRQASNARREIEAVDPGNRLLARQNRLRLDAEIVRDSALVASGALSRKIGGQSVFPPQPDHAMDASQVKKTWKPSQGADRYRRGMYTHFWRITPHPALVVFDQPNAMMVCTRRARTTTPLQALTLLNDSAFHELARALAARIAEGAGSREEMLDMAFRSTVARRPDAAERERLLRLYATELDAFQGSPEEAERIAGKNDAGLAAWTAVARVLLNTDEFITRE